MLTATFLALALRQEGKTTFPFVPKKDESWSYRLNLKDKSEAEFEVAGRVTYHVSDVAKDGSWTNRIVGSELVANSGGREEDLPEAEFTTDRDAFGVVKDWKAYEPKESVGFDVLELAFGYAPPAPVGKGESWNGRVPGGSEMKPFRFTYVGEETVANKPYLKLTLSGSAPLSGDVEGAIWLSPDRYRVARFLIQSTKAEAEKRAFSMKFEPAE